MEIVAVAILVAFIAFSVWQLGQHVRVNKTWHCVVDGTEHTVQLTANLLIREIRVDGKLVLDAWISSNMPTVYPFQIGARKCTLEIGRAYLVWKPSYYRYVDGFDVPEAVTPP